MLAGILLIVVNTVYVCYALDLDNGYVPSGKTVQIHTMYAAAIGERLAYLKADPRRWAKTSQGKRQMAGGGPMVAR